MNSSTAYTELESLLLFQALRAEGVAGVTPTTFNRISEQLKKVPLIYNDPKYDGGRLSPDALREWYLALLKEEVKQDLERQAIDGVHLTNGHVSPGSRKRKAPSPSLPTVREAQQHSHLIPQLVARLYARYRQVTVSRLQSYEKKYAEVKLEISEIEAGHQDDLLQHKQPATQRFSPKRSPKPSSTLHTQQGPAYDQNLQPTEAASTESLQTVGEDGTQNQSKRFSQAKIDAVINHEPEPQHSADGHRRVSSNTTLPPLSEMAPQSPRFGIPPKISGPVPTQLQQMPQGANHGYTHSPPTGHHSPYSPQYARQRSGSLSSPQAQQSLSRPSSSPRPILPPPKGMQLPLHPTAGSPNSSSAMHASPPLQPKPYHPPQQPYQQQHRIPSGPPPNTEGPLRTYTNAPPSTQPSGYHHQQLSYADRRSSYPAQNLQQNQPYPNQSPHAGGGYMLPPFTVQSQESPKPTPPQQQQIRSQQTPVLPQRPLPYAITGYGGSATGPRNLLPHTSRLVSDIVSALATPPRPKFKPLWKNEYPAHIAPTPKPRPEIEPLSPTLERAKSPTRSTRSTRSNNVAPVEQRTQLEPTPKARTRKRKANARDKSPHSVVSSTADESLRARTRSQSVSTAVGANPSSDDRPGSRNGVKPEPSTPANMLEESDVMAAPSGTPASGMVTRKRRGTIQSQPPPPAKRKRQDSPSMSAKDQGHLPTPPPRSDTVIAARNFAKMSSAIMDDITSHKHASYFAKEVREKDAPGYSDIVRQPQNLKSIRGAITAGARAIAAASSNVDSPSGTSSTTSSTVELERSADLIPPKAIVNAAQLEKELMRMFANAYLFNPGEDGMALSTKEMSEDVEQKISEWRGTKRDVGRDATVDEDEEVKGKRRKL